MVFNDLRRSLRMMFEPSSSKHHHHHHQTNQKDHHHHHHNHTYHKEQHQREQLWQKDKTVSLIKPPKAPSWRDFIPSENRDTRRHSLDTKPSDHRSSKDERSSPDSQEKSRTVQRHKKRHRKSKLHRTRSQMLLDPDDIPERLTMSLAEAQARHLQLTSRVPDLLNAERYMTHAQDKCRRWLAGLEKVEFEREETFGRRHDVLPTSVSCGDLVEVGVASSSSSEDHRRFSGLSIDDIRQQQTSGLL